jgi:hypothetical protein
MNKLYGLIVFQIFLVLATATGLITNLVMLFGHHETLWDIAIGIAGVSIIPIGVIRGLGHLFGAW